MSSNAHIESKQGPGLAFAETEIARNATVNWFWAEQFSESILPLIQSVDWRVVMDLGQMAMQHNAIHQHQYTVGAFTKTTAILMLLKEQEAQITEFLEIARNQVKIHHETRHGAERSEG